MTAINLIIEVFSALNYLLLPFLLPYKKVEIHYGSNFLVIFYNKYQFFPCHNFLFSS